MPQFKYELIAVSYSHALPKPGERGFDADPGEVTVLLYEFASDDSEGGEIITRDLPRPSPSLAEFIDRDGFCRYTVLGDAGMTLEKAIAEWTTVVETRREFPRDDVTRADGQLYVESCLFKLLGMMLSEAGTPRFYHRLYEADVPQYDMQDIDDAGLWVRKGLNTMAGKVAEQYPINMDYCKSGLVFWIGESTRRITIPDVVLLFKTRQIRRLREPDYYFE